ncbi:MAG: Gfo/Idh/MocA family oxidoreductase [Chloroflexota bacterium]|nr:Gfo/Idh/MocA family oxidoreductase [Chloroflexota bacterium]
MEIVEPQDRVRVGVIGCGAGLFHLEGYAEEPRAEIVALAGLDTDRCQELAKRFDVPHVYRDYAELLAHPNIDAVSIAVPNHLHMPIAVAALEFGKHVLVEKPLARNSDEGQRMVETAQRAERVLAIAFQRRSRHDVELVRNEVLKGNIGRVYHARAFWLRRSGIPGLGSWFTSKEQAGGGPLIDLGVHVLDMALWMMGNPRVTSVSAATYAELGPRGTGQWQGSRFTIAEDVRYEVEDFATALLRLEGGGTLQLDASWAAYTNHTDEFGVSLLGSHGGAEIHVKDYAQTGTLKLFGEIDGVPTVTEPRLVPRKGHGILIGRFFDSILSGAPADPSGEEGLERVRLIEAIYRSAAEGREILVEA